MDLKVGDTVKYVNEEGKGVILEVSPKLITVENELGFTEKRHPKELILDLPLDIDEVQIKDAFNPSDKKVEKAISKDKIYIADLHYGQLENYEANLPHHLILQRQINAAKQALEIAQAEGYKKIILIHGKGKGKLQAQIYALLEQKGLHFYDADYARYKLGAVEVEF